MKLAAVLALVVAMGMSPGLPSSLAEIQRQAQSPGPYRDVTVTAADADAYWAGAGAARLPQGVSEVRLNAEPGALTGSARIDFDHIAAHGQAGWMLMMFRGVHAVAARAVVNSAVAPRATLTITQVWLDGHEIPEFLVNAALAAFVTSRYPNIGRTFTVPLPRHASEVSEGKGWIQVHYPHGS